MDTFGGKPTNSEILFFVIFAAMIALGTLGVLGFALWVFLT